MYDTFNRDFLDYFTTLHLIETVHTRNVTTGTTGLTMVAPKFSVTFTLFQPEGTDSAPPLQRLHQNFPRGYISAQKYNEKKRPKICNGCRVSTAKNYCSKIAKARPHVG